MWIQWTLMWHHSVLAICCWVDLDSLILMLHMVVILIVIHLCTREFIMCSNQCLRVVLNLKFLPQ
jgi:hypothetical protein